MTIKPLKDQYGEVINGENTYEYVANSLKRTGSCLIGWSAGNGTHLDILFTFTAPSEGIIQGGVHGSDLFVSIMRLGAFGFDPIDVTIGTYHPSYIEEKLGLRRVDAVPMTDLLIGVLKRMNKHINRD